VSRRAGGPPRSAGLRERTEQNRIRGVEALTANEASPGIIGFTRFLGFRYGIGYLGAGSPPIRGWFHGNTVQRLRASKQELIIIISYRGFSNESTNWVGS
jgi:hypothetical protein